ncbi:MAG: flagellar hook-length control protein FliK [Lachnospiraceae bacterium]|nr:flagellar hook-length control protein FliK [Lachnospiraceae bacterium]
MSSASIKEIASYYIGNVGSDSSRTAVGTGQDNFSQVFQKTNAAGSGDTSGAKTGRSDADSIQNHANIQKKNTPDRLQEKQQVAEQMAEDERMLEAAEEAGAQMVEEVAKTFNVTVEEVETVMEELGLVPMDLLNGEKLTQLVLGLNPEADYMTIVTNEQLFADLKGLMNTAQDLMNQMAQEFQMSNEQLTDMLAALQEAEASVGELVAEGVEELQVEAEVTEEPQVDVETEGLYGKSLSKDADGQTQTVETAAKPVDNQTEKSQSEAGAGNRDHAKGQNGGESFAANMLNQLSQAVENTAGGETTSYGVNGQDIINQITEQIKILVKADTTEMELQLNPASLGSLKVQIASKSGVLTATFTTENEAVKAALEGQLVQLKENFEQQGLKVESVEVNVQTRGFERGLDQQDREQNGFQEEKKKSGRRISLSGLEEAGEELPEEELSEGDKIVADMMIRNGNSVDYTV